MTNEEMNVKADQIAVRVRDAVGASQNAQDIYGLVFVNVKALIAELVSAAPTERKLLDQLTCARVILADVSHLTTDPLVKGPIDEFLSVPIPRQ